MSGEIESVSSSPKNESVFDILLNDESEANDISIEINSLTAETNDSSDEETTSSAAVRRRIRRFTDSDSESEADKENNHDKENILPEDGASKLRISSESDEDVLPRKSRLLTNSDSSDDEKSSPVEESRIGNRRNKLQDKFKGLLSSRSKAPDLEKDEDPNMQSEHHDSSSEDSESGIESIKQKIKKKSMLLKSGICDPDTSEDESEATSKKQKQRSTILMSPKPIRISAKQAMENMQKIKSESNRMLREKEVSLPYHRPKALSLKDIMSRRKTALSADGKALPVKMNSEQLKQYVKFLEQRNKDMMELCKSESEDEEEAENGVELNEVPKTDCSKDSTENVSAKEETNGENPLPYVNLSEKLNDDDLPDLNVEIVSKEQDKTTVSGENDDDVVMKDVSEHTEAQSIPNNATNDESQLTELHYETDKLESTEDQIKELNEDDRNSPSNKCQDNVQNGNEEIEQNVAAESESKNVLDNEDANGEISKGIESNNSTSHEKQEITKADTADSIEKDKSEEFDDSFSDGFSDTDINMEDLEKIIENAKNATDTDDTVNSPMLVRDPPALNIKPRLTGAPGMVIDLDGSNAGSRKLTGVELLKERFTYYAKLKTPEEKERERELTIKPGMQHLKLKQELEDKISEQRSLEWAKRLADEKEQQMEMDAVRGDESDEDDIDKIEAKLEEKEKEECNVASESDEEEEDEEEDCIVEDKPRKRNPMIDDEAEVSDDETEENNAPNKNYEAVEEDGNDDNDDDEQEDSDESSDDTSEEEEDNKSKPRKGRILKAFEDSDDESSNVDNETAKDDIVTANTVTNNIDSSQAVKDSQDDILPLAQTNKALSEDLFDSQASVVLPSSYPKIVYDANKSDKESSDLGTQTFSIMNTNTSEKSSADDLLKIPDQLDIVCDTQPVDDSNLDDVVGMCSGKFTQTQNVITAETQMSESQAMGDDVLALCTGQFYDNQFVSQTESSEKDVTSKENKIDKEKEKVLNEKTDEEKDLFDSILKEMNEPVVEKSKTNKYVFDNATGNEAVSFDSVPQVKKKFVIDSDDEVDETNGSNKPARKKKFKKKKQEKRALQISDDEEEEKNSQSEEEAIEYMSEDEDDGVERIVEYDSEENEVEVRPQNQKKKRKMAEFFEQEAELTSEDEWAGSGDEDEAGLDRMEKEAGDDDTFNQGELQKELGQIHMRDVLDQDKREVRLIQELLFEDGDLGDGHRQRKFRWKNLDGENDTDAVPNIFAESQEEEFESEEQWRKQRHEREVFLRSMQKEKEAEDQNISIDRSTIIKANLCSKTMSSLLLEVNGNKIEETVVVEKKVTKEEPAPLTVVKQNYHGSLLTRGRGALARLAALALPLAGDADDDRVATVGPSSRRNFVFATVSPAPKEPKVSKRKANNTNVGTPRLIKKLKTEDKQLPKSSLLDHLRAL